MSNDQVVEQRRFSDRESENRAQTGSIADIAFRCESSSKSFGRQLDACLAAAGEERNRGLDVILLKELLGSPSRILVRKMKDKRMVFK